jgi:hypothetical protein
VSDRVPSFLSFTKIIELGVDIKIGVEIAHRKMRLSPPEELNRSVTLLTTAIAL